MPFATTASTIIRKILYKTDYAEFLRADPYILRGAGTMTTSAEKIVFGTMSKPEGIAPLAIHSTTLSVAAKRLVKDNENTYTLKRFSGKGSVVPYENLRTQLGNSVANTQRYSFLEMAQNISFFQLAEIASQKTKSAVSTAATLSTGTKRAGDKATIGNTTKVKAITFDDIIGLAQKFDSKDVPKTGRVLLIPPSVASDLLKLEKFTSLDYVGNGKITSARLGTIAGFITVESTNVPRYRVATASSVDTYTIQGDYDTFLTAFKDSTNKETLRESVLAFHLPSVVATPIDPFFSIQFTSVVDRGPIMSYQALAGAYSLYDEAVEVILLPSS